MSEENLNPAETPAVDSAVPTPDAGTSVKSGIPFAEIIAKAKTIVGFIPLEGRARRSEYWGVYLLAVLPLAILAAIFVFIGYSVVGGGNLRFGYVCSALSATLGCVSTLALFPVAVRRAHDIGIGGWAVVGLVCAALIPYVGFVVSIAWIALGCIPGKCGDNPYGADPLSSDAGGAVAKTDPAPLLWVVLVPIVVLNAAISTGMIFQSVVEQAMKRAFGG